MSDKTTPTPMPRITTKIKGAVSRGIKAVYINEDRHLIMVLTDNSEIDLGFIGVDNEGSGSVSEKEIISIVESYLEKNHPTASPASSSPMVDLLKYGIVAADYEAPFTAEMYEVAYNNGLGIQRAIDDAKAAGQRDIVIPAGNYPVCYSGDVDLCSYPVINACGVNLFGYGVKLYVIYDEEGTNPYFTGETPRLLQGQLIVTDSDVRGFHLVGERRYRLDENTKYREASCGIGLMPYTRGNVIADCICELFSGDGIGCSQYMEQLAGWPNDTFTSVDWNSSENAFVESTTMWTSSVHDGTWIDQTKPLILRCTGYFLYSSAPLRILCFDANNSLLGTVRFWQGEYFYLLPNTAKWYLQMVREVEHDVTSTETWSYWIGNAYYCDTLIENCKCRFNQRGGMSNLPTNTTVRNCEIHHNGCAYDGMPAFYDGTQFGIDIEDVFIHNISVEGCNIHANTHAVLYRCWGIRFKDCYLQGYVQSLNSCSDFFAENTNFGWSCTMTTPTPFGNKTAIGCKFGGNVAPEINVIGKAVTTASISKVDNTQVEFMDSMGNVLFSLDLSMLGKNFGDVVISKGLLFDGDMTKFTADTLELPDNTGNVAMKLSRESFIMPYGIGSNGGNEVSVDCTWNETQDFGNNFAVEIFFIGGVPYMPWRGANKTGTLISTVNTSGELLTSYSSQVYVCNITSGIQYINTSDVISNTTGVGVASHAYIDDNGNYKIMSENNIPGIGVTQYGHYVLNFNENGIVEGYINGYKHRLGKETTDFKSWYTEPFETAMCIWSGAYGIERYHLRAARIYNRCLSHDEIKNNLLYEVNRLGSVWRIAITATNATIENTNGYFIKEGETYTTNVTAKDGYTLSNVVVKMAGENITATAYSNGVITIPAVTGVVEITATATA